MNVGSSDHRRPCRYGDKCYQKNPMHLEKFTHPEDGQEPPKEDAKENQKVSPNKRKREEDEVDHKPMEPKPSPEKRTRKSAKENKEEPEEDKKEVTIDEEEEQLPTPPPKDIKEHLKQKFMVNFPEDFFSFWDFCKEKNPTKPQDALLAATGLKLVGPYDLLYKESNAAKKCTSPSGLLTHWRFYYDVPEFQTVLANEDTHFHIGYFRDDPKTMPEFVASADPKNAKTPCKLSPLGENLFGALYQYLSTLVRTAADPFKITALEKLKESVHVYATMKARATLEAKTQRMKARDKRRQTATFHSAGMVVPFDKKNDLGYREVPETTASLKKLLGAVVNASTDEESDKAMDAIHELITNVQFANDEGDPGMGLELGLNAFLFGGKRLTGSVMHLLNMAYELVGRPEFAKIASAHLKRRKEGEFCRLD